jgi:hypothetical protein
LLLFRSFDRLLEKILAILSKTNVIIFVPKLLSFGSSLCLFGEIFKIITLVSGRHQSGSPEPGRERGAGPDGGGQNFHAVGRVERGRHLVTRKSLRPSQLNKLILRYKQVDPSQLNKLIRRSSTS